MAQFNMMNGAVFFLPLLIFVTIIEAYPSLLTVKMMNGHEEIILNWRLTDQHLANKNLPIWSAFKNAEPTLIPNVMDNIGPFAMYHDVLQSSAVVFFEKTKTFSGVVDTRFLIEDLPLHMIMQRVTFLVNGAYVKFRDPPGFDAVAFSPVLPPQPNLNSRQSHNIRCNDPQGGEVLYAEILVLIGYDIVKNYLDPIPLAETVKFYIVYFNAIDVLYAQLVRNGVVIHLNIAGMIIESDRQVFPYAFVPGTQQSKIDAIKTLEKVGRYLKKYNKKFTVDSYDLSYLLTSHPIMWNSVVLRGVSHDFMVYKLKKTKNAIQKLPGCIVQNAPQFKDIFTGTHEIAHTMHIIHDIPSDGIIHNNHQCSSLMQPVESYCRNCLKWSEFSIAQFQQYIRHPDHCILLNRPRSLHPYGTAMVTLTPVQQCVCYNYRFHSDVGGSADRVFSHRCNMKLQCTNNPRNANPVSAAVPIPVDGTPCGINKVCRDKECIEITRHH